MKIDFKKLIIGILVFSVLLVAFSLVYYYIYFLPQKESMQLKYEEEKEIKRLELEVKQIELERQKLEEDRKERESVRERNRYLLEECLSLEYDAYLLTWDKACEELGLKKDCFLPPSDADRLDKIHQDRRDDCFKKYPLD